MFFNMLALRKVVLKEVQLLVLLFPFRLMF